LHNNYADGVTWLNTQLEMFFSANPGLSCVHLTLPMLKPSDGGHPTLKCKAATCRHLAAFALFLAQRHTNIGLMLEDERLVEHSAEYRELAVEVATHLGGYHASCTAEPFNVARCQDEMQAFLVAYDKLRRLFRRGLEPELHSAQVFGPRPKYHLCDHLVKDKVPLYGSPRLSWCYGDEDFVGLIKRIALCTKNSRTLEKVLLSKYRLYAWLHAAAVSAAGVAMQAA
jgi:hypothetical protein